MTFDNETENSPMERTLYPEFILTSNNLLACQIAYNTLHYSQRVRKPNTNVQFTTVTAVHGKGNRLLTDAMPGYTLFIV